MDNNTLNDEFLTPEQIADKLQMHPYTIRRYIREKKLRAMRFGRTLRIRRSEFDRFLSEMETDKDTELPRNLAG